MMRLIVAATVGLLLLGCGASQPTTDPAPFKAAVERYLKSQSMGLQVREFKSLTVEDDTATAEVALSAADEGIPQVQVRWTFAFARQNGEWTVSSHQE